MPFHAFVGAGLLGRECGYKVVLEGASCHEKDDGSEYKNKEGIRRHQDGGGTPIAIG